MRNQFFAAACLCASMQMQAQTATPSIEPNLKYGKPSKEELAMTVYDRDTTAVALVLFHTGKSEFSYSIDDFLLSTQHFVRLKILKPEGVDYANITVPYYSPAERLTDKDDIYKIEACAYNIENGKCVKTPMKKEFISRERVNDKIMLLKFSVPAVKAGTVIEYSYQAKTDYYYHIDNWEMQGDIPVVYNQYNITLPNTFIYNIEIRGKDHVQTKEKETSTHITVNNPAGQPESIGILSRDITFTAWHLPAIKQEEAYCWCPDDYKVQVSFELEGTNFPGTGYKPYTKTWEDIDKNLLNQENETFGKQLSLTNPFRTELKAVYSDQLSFYESLVCAIKLLKSKIAWNGKYQLYSKDPLKAKEARSGSNADLNFILIGMLKDLGFKSYPVVLSLRSNGVLPFTYPSVQKLSTFILAVEKPDGGYVYLDGSMPIPAVNILPQQLLAEKARILNPQEDEDKRWVNLRQLSNNLTRVLTQVTITPEEVKGNTTIVHQEQKAEEFLKEKHQQEDQASYIRQLAATLNCRIDDYHVDQTTSEQIRVAEQFKFTRKIDNNNDRLYINPMIFAHLTANPFTQTERVLPVEFPYPYSHYTTVTLLLPEGYTIEELPKSQSVMTEDGKLSFKYIVEKKEKQIDLQYTFQMKTATFIPLQYTQLQKVWSTAIEKNNALIVLKKL